MDNDDKPIGRVLSRRDVLILIGASNASVLAGCAVAPLQSSATATATTAATSDAALAAVATAAAPGAAPERVGGVCTTLCRSGRTHARPAHAAAHRPCHPPSTPRRRAIPHLHRTVATSHTAIHTIVSALPISQSPISQFPHLIEPLSDREREVLRLLATGLTYQQIADRLIVSVNTVRFHVKAIYGKLGVDKRLAAIEAARRLGLV